MSDERKSNSISLGKQTIKLVIFGMFIWTLVCVGYGFLEATILTGENLVVAQDLTLVVWAAVLFVVIAVSVLADAILERINADAKPAPSSTPN
jgi:hypothetical protein